MFSKYVTIICRIFKNRDNKNCQQLFQTLLGKLLESSHKGIYQFCLRNLFLKFFLTVVVSPGLDVHAGTKDLGKKCQKIILPEGILISGRQQDSKAGLETTSLSRGPVATIEESRMQLSHATKRLSILMALWHYQPFRSQTLSCSRIDHSPPTGSTGEANVTVIPCQIKLRYCFGFHHMWKELPSHKFKIFFTC